MKTFVAQVLQHQRQRLFNRNVGALLRFLIVFVVMVAVYSVAFHHLMEYEGRYYSWLTGVYWTLTTMTTLGFGDITFHSDAGKAFSIVVLLSGVIFLLVVLPFTFIEYVLEPLMRAQTAARAPREISESVNGHVILTRHDEVTGSLIRRLGQYGIPYVVLVPVLEEGLRLHDLGIQVVLGELDDPETYRNVGIERAALVATTASDPTNASVAFTVRQVSAEVPIVATANDPASVDLLELAGCNHVLQPAEALGQMLARHTTGTDALSHEIGRFGDLILAESTAARTPIVGKTLGAIDLEKATGVRVLGTWERGRFHLATPELVIGENAVLILAGKEADFARYDEMFCIYNVSATHAVILGGGRVGRATGRALARRGMDYRIVERNAERIKDDGKYVHGNAAEFNVLLQAGLRRAPAVAITTHDDAINIYLTIYCRRLRPDIQILVRTTEERNVSTLHRAGADFVMSYASMGASTLFNRLRHTDVLMVAEGLNVLKVRCPRQLAGRTLAEASASGGEGWSLVAARIGDAFVLDPPAEHRLTENQEIIVIGSGEAEERFVRRYAKA